MCVSFLVGRVVHLQVPARARQRKQLRGGMRRALLTEGGILGRPHRRGQPQASPLVEHRVVHVVLAGPDRFFTEVRGGRRHLRRGRRRARVAHVKRNLADGVRLRIEHRDVVGAQLERAVQQTVRIDRRLAAIRRHHVVQVRLRIRPIPHRDHDVALDALRPWRRRRHFAAVDAIGPIGEEQQRALLAHIVDAVQHLRAGLARGEPALPRMLQRRERAELLRDLARAFRAQLMARRAAAGLDHPQPLGLALDVRIDAVALRAGAGKFAGFRNAEQRQPLAGGVILRGRVIVGRNHRRQVQRLARRGHRAFRINQAIPAHEDRVIRLRQIGQQVASLVVGDDDPDEGRWELFRLRDHPDAGFGALAAAHHAADVVAVHGNRRRLPRADGCQGKSEERNHTCGRQSQTCHDVLRM